MLLVRKLVGDEHPVYCISECFFPIAILSIEKKIRNVHFDKDKFLLKKRVTSLFPVVYALCTTISIRKSTPKCGTYFLQATPFSG